jgi:hypothetical protein
MKNKRMLSIGKFNFSPSLEQTPKALSSKNNLSFSMVGAKWMWTKVLIKSSRLQTHLIIRLFCLVFVFFSAEQKLYSQQAPLKYLGSIELAPQKLRLEKDSIRFLISGKLAIGSGLLTKQPEVRLRLLAKQDSLDLGR